MIRKTVFWLHLGTGVASGLVVPLALGAGAALAQDGNDVSADARMHAERGLQAAADFPGYASLCDLDMTFRNVNLPRTGQAQAREATSGNAASGADAASSADAAATASERAARPSTPPAQVFDNLFFVGSASVSAWLLGTEDGYILIDAMNTNEEARSIIEAGIIELGLDPTGIEYLLITHAHGDHYGGYRYIKDTYDPAIVMSEADWQLASTLGEHPRFGFPPDEDVSVTDGDQLQAGTTTLDIIVTPGHTPGTISPAFTVYDQGQPYRAMLWGGTGFNFGPNYEQMNDYAASAQRLGEIARQQNVQVFLSNHSRRDGSLERIRELNERGPGDPHPFVQGEELLAVFDVLEQCALAQAARIQEGDL